MGVGTKNVKVVVITQLIFFICNKNCLNALFIDMFTLQVEGKFLSWIMDQKSSETRE